MENSPASTRWVVLVMLTLAALSARPAPACTRCLHVFDDGSVIVGRSMDWVEDPSGDSAIFEYVGGRLKIRNASAPLGISTPGESNVASTIWRTVYDQKNRVLYFDATSPTVFWMPLDQLDVAAGSPVKRLPLKSGETYSGDAIAALRAAHAFPFLEAKPE